MKKQQNQKPEKPAAKDPGPRPADLSPQAVWPPRVVPDQGPVTHEAEYVVRTGDPVKGGLELRHRSELSARDEKSRTSSLDVTDVDFAAEPTQEQRAQTRERRAPATVSPKGGK